jgi:hypothetical protein
LVRQWLSGLFEIIVMLRTSVQFTVEELEIMLDSLGPESNEDTREKKRLHEKLKETLQFLREKNNLKNSA